MKEQQDECVGATGNLVHKMNEILGREQLASGRAIVVLNDGETWSPIDGVKILFVLDDETEEDCIKKNRDFGCIFQPR